jgi:lactate racemase
MPTTVPIRYQGQDTSLGLPAGWSVIAIADPKPATPLADVTARVAAALEAPIGSPGIAELCRGAKTVTIACDDQARPTPTAPILEAVRQSLLSHGIKDENCTVIIAKGTHRWPNEAEIARKVGPVIGAAWKVVVHDPDDDAVVGYQGTTSRGTAVYINKLFSGADVRIGLGGIVTHYMAGYGGGPKIMLPGVSARKTIQANHFLAHSNRAAQAEIDGNPMYEDLIEASRLAGMQLKIDALLDVNNKLVDVIIGEVAAGHRAAIAAYNAVYGYEVQERSDVTIACGYPLENELIQSCKAVLSSDLATRDGGTVILLASCSTGAGPGFAEAMSAKPEIALVWDWVRDGKTTPTGGPMVARVMGVFQRKRVILVTTGIEPDVVRAMGFEYAPTPEAAIELAQQAHPTARVTVFPAGAAINPLRVAVAV